MKHLRSNLWIAASIAIPLGSCALLSAEPPLPPPPPIITAPPPAPKVVVEQVCITTDIWTSGAQADAATALAPLVHANPNVAHLVKEWSRLRDDAIACKVAQTK